VEGKSEVVTDAQLICKVGDDDQAAFTILVHRYLSCLIRFSARYTYSISCSEDIVQESFLRVWNHANSWCAKKGTVKSWLFKIVYNLTMDFLRKQQLLRTHQESLNDELRVTNGPEENLLDAEQKRQVHQALSNLPERQRTALTLFLVNGLSGSEVASVLELTVEASDSLLARARRNLKKIIQKEPLMKRTVI